MRFTLLAEVKAKLIAREMRVLYLVGAWDRRCSLSTSIGVGSTVTEHGK